MILSTKAHKRVSVRWPRRIHGDGHGTSSHLAWGAPGLVQVRVGVSPLTVLQSLEQRRALGGL